MGLEEKRDRLGEEEEEMEEEETFWETKYYDTLEMWDRFRDFAWDPVNRTVLGRDKKSWCEIGIFYFIFYSCLAAFWAIALVLFMRTLPTLDEGPKYTNLIDSPGLNPSTGSATVQFGGTNTALLNANRNLLRAGRYDPENATDVNRLLVGAAKGCQIESTMGDNSTICVFLSVNRVFGWAPRSPQLNITCNLKNGDLQKKYGSEFLEVAGGTLPNTLFMGMSIHAYSKVNTNYRNPIVAVVFKTPETVTAGDTVEVVCFGDHSELSTEASFTLNFI